MLHRVAVLRSEVASLAVGLVLLFTMFSASKLSLRLRGWVPPVLTLSLFPAHQLLLLQNPSNDDSKITLLKIKQSVWMPTLLVPSEAHSLQSWPRKGSTIAGLETSAAGTGLSCSTGCGAWPAWGRSLWVSILLPGLFSSV